LTSSCLPDAPGWISILIEVKGAEFNLLNANHYKAFNHKITQAAGQISQRLGIIFRDLNSFRKEAHAIRKASDSY
jgi:hypothetical protein